MYIATLLRDCMGLSPLASRRNSSGLILLPSLGNIWGEGVVWIRGTEESLDGEKNSSYLQCGRPVTWQNVSITHMKEPT